MTHDELAAALRAAVPPANIEGARPGRDLWPLITAGPERRAAAWPWIDIGLAAAGAGALFLRSDLLFVLLWHL